MDQFGQTPFQPTPGSGVGIGNHLNNQDSAILYLGDPDPFGQQPFAPPPVLPSAPPQVNNNNENSNQHHQDGHAILDQVQKELQFLPSNEQFVSGQLSGGSAPPLPSKSSASSGGGIPSGVMDPSVPDTDYLIGTDPISLGSPLSPGSMSSATAMMGGGGGPEDGPPSTRIKYSIWQSEYYAQFFDLSTDIFFRRVLWSLLPLTGDNKGK